MRGMPHSISVSSILVRFSGMSERLRNKFVSSDLPYEIAEQRTH